MHAFLLSIDMDRGIIISFFTLEDVTNLTLWKRKPVDGNMQKEKRKKFDT